MTIETTLRSSIRSGLRSGLNPVLSGDPFAGVSRDATSSKYVPANATEWGTFLSAVGLSGVVATPDSLWLCQEAAGNLADSIGALTLTATGTPQYARAVAGWTRTGVGDVDAGTSRFAAAAGVGPSPATTSQTWLWFVNMPATPAGSRVPLGLNFTSATNSFRLLHLLTTGNPRAQVAGVNTDGANSISSEFHCIVMKYNRTGSEAKLFTLDEKVTGTYSAAINDGAKGIGNGSAATFVYGCMWSGANSEISDANLKTLVQGFGFTAAWT